MYSSWYRSQSDDSFLQNIQIPSCYSSYFFFFFFFVGQIPVRPPGVFLFSQPNTTNPNTTQHEKLNAHHFRERAAAPQSECTAS